LLLIFHKVLKANTHFVLQIDSNAHDENCIGHNKSGPYAVICNKLNVNEIWKCNVCKMEYILSVGGG